MPDKTVSTFAPPCAMPTGLQWTDEGLYVIDQYSDRVYLMDEEGFIVRAFETPTANGSGISHGGGYLWTASNGSNTRREPHDTDGRVQTLPATYVEEVYLGLTTLHLVKLPNEVELAVRQISDDMADSVFQPGQEVRVGWKTAEARLHTE